MAGSLGRLTACPALDTLLFLFLILAISGITFDYRYRSVIDCALSLCVPPLLACV
jgi:hypothetical protein